MIIKKGYSDNDVCIYKQSNEFIQGSFFKDKPTIGTIIETSTNVNFTVDEILLNRDAKICEGCQKDPKKAFFELKVHTTTQEEIEAQF